MCFRCKPHRDVHVLHHKDGGHGPRSPDDSEDFAVLIDATLKETFPPIALPKPEYMENAKAIWEEIGLPKLWPEAPWFGYDLGEFTEHLSGRRNSRCARSIGRRASGASSTDAPMSA